MNNNSRAALALGLATLVVPDSPTLANGYQLLTALEWAAETPNEFLPDDHLYYKAGHLARLGFMERENERGAGAWRYRVTDCGLRFLGLAETNMMGAQAGWVRVYITGGQIDINLADMSQHRILAFYAKQLK